MTAMAWCPSPSRALIDLSAISDNLAQLRTRVGDRQVMLAVKAEAYGHGSVAVARHVEATGTADWLAVATVAEGQKLVDAGVGLPILKLSPAFPENLGAAVRAGLRLTVLDPSTVELTELAAARLDRTARVHVNVDTGMGRIGLPPAELDRVVEAVDRCDHLELEGIYTHLPVSDTPDGREFTVAQIDQFLAAVERVVAHRGPVPQVHVANSGAILGHDLGATTMVRAGIAAYGYDPDPGAGRVRLRPAMEWVSRISFVKQVEAGTTIGYGRTWTAPRRTTIATVPVGYADGYDRGLSNRGEVIVAGRRVPVVGRVCMDQFMVDLGPDATDGVGKEVVLMGRRGQVEVSADDLAAWTGTISYEVTCGLSPRVDRVWQPAP